MNDESILKEINEIVFPTPKHAAILGIIAIPNCFQTKTTQLEA